MKLSLIISFFVLVISYAFALETITEDVDELKDKGVSAAQREAGVGFTCLQGSRSTYICEQEGMSVKIIVNAK